MYKIIAFCLLLSALVFAQSSVWVNGYYRKDGTYVQGHYRTSPDNSTYNNYWSKDYPSQSSSSGSYSSSSSDGYSSMVWVDGYYRKDGSYVPGHWRKK